MSIIVSQLEEKITVLSAEVALRSHETAKEHEKKIETEVIEVETEKKEEKTVQTDQNDAYVSALENKLVHILENVDGVGRVEVMITLKSSKESVLNKDLSEERQTEQEKNSDTQKTNKNEKRQEETILSDSVGNSAPYVVKELEPEIAGIIISCEGAENKVVAASVLEAAQVLFGVSANHIKVLKMEGAK